MKSGIPRPRRPSDRLYAAWRLSLYGLRRGEVLGLRWSDVDLKARTLTVNQARVLADLQVPVEEPKSRNGKRTLPSTMSWSGCAHGSYVRNGGPAIARNAGSAYRAGLDRLDGVHRR